MVSGYLKYPREALLKVSSRSNIRKLVKTSPIIKVSSRPPSLFLKSWRIGMFLMELEMVSRYSIYPREVLPKVSSRSNIWKFVKNPPILSHFLESWRKGMFLMELEMVSWY